MTDARSADFLKRLGVELPILQAPMAGTSTPAMAAAVSNAGGLGGVAVGAVGADGARKMISEYRVRSNRPFNVNVFAHARPRADAARETAWIERLTPLFAELGAEPPKTLSEIYTSFVDDDAMLALLLAERPKALSMHFGLPEAARLRALKEAGILLLATATSLAEAQTLAAAGVDAIVAQGFEAGGHRGMFDPDAPDEKLGTFALTRILAREIDLPIVAAGGVMDGAGVSAALALGAAAAQLGTAYIATAESAADEGYRAALFSEAAHRTVMTRAISGRPARCLANRFTALGLDAQAPAYPIAYDLGKALNAAGKAAGERGYGAQWAGQGAPLARRMSAGALTRQIAAEIR